VGMVNVNDERLEQIAKVVNAKKIVPATCEFIDIAGIVK
jgi:ribosome-binding ATPase YchF (GTP1/OBG family)